MLTILNLKIRYRGGSPFTRTGVILKTKIRKRRGLANKYKEEQKMGWQVILALVLVIPVILIPVAFIWYLNIGGIHALRKEAKERRAAGEKGIKTEAVESHVEVGALD